MARTRQKAKQRKAKRLEQERKAAERSRRDETGAAATAEAVAEVDQAQRDAAAEVEEAQEAEAIDAPEVAPVPVRTAEPEKATRPSRLLRRRAEPEQKEKAKPQPKPARRAERKPQPRQRGRVVNFLIQVWAELRRVQWPDRNQVTQATAVTIVFCAVAGAYLGIWDFLFNKLIKAIL